jgi:hypothetical protein
VPEGSQVANYGFDVTPARVLRTIWPASSGQAANDLIWTCTKPLLDHLVGGHLHDQRHPATRFNCAANMSRD